MKFFEGTPAGVIWISWERHRRTAEIARELKVPVHVLSESSDEISLRIFRYLFLGAKTIGLLFKDRPLVVFAQNPSIVLAAILSATKDMFGFVLVIDRHSNFKLDKKKGLMWRGFHLLSRYTVRRADLTIVTNDFLCNLVEEWRGRGYVLQDKLPKLSAARPVSLEGKRKIVCISSFSNDEPTKEIIEAARAPELKDVMIYITGHRKKYEAQKDEIGALPPNVRLTGFLPETEYQSLLISVDAVMVLTKQDHTLNCGAYEAVALGKPMVLSNTEAIKRYFTGGAVFCESTSREIKEAILKCTDNAEELETEVARLRNRLTTDWQKRFEGLAQMLATWNTTSAGQRQTSAEEVFRSASGS